LNLIAGNSGTAGYAGSGGSIQITAGASGGGQLFAAAGGGIQLTAGKGGDAAQSGVPGGNGGSITLQPGGGGGSVSGTPGGPGNVLLAPSGGKVGIGTTSPETTLDVIGALKVGPSGPPSPSGGGLKLGAVSGGYKWIQSYEGQALVLNPLANNVGIGTTTPDPNVKLDVQGGPIKATGGLIIENRTSDPSSPATGQIWLRTDL